MTPLVEVGGGVLVKQEHVSPTGSFKDRGAALLTSIAKDRDASTMVVDSSGNAGKSVAAYAARAGLSAEVHVPVATPEAKVEAARASGAKVVVVEGSREDAARSARDAVEKPGSFYASHVHQPAFVHGVKTIAFELWEQLGGQSPGSVVVPAGNGTLVQAMWLGFSELRAARRVASLPRMFAVQAERCAPLAGMRPAPQPTSASGIAIASPPRAGQVRGAVLATGGAVVTVSEDDLLRAREELAASGCAVEITSAASWAAFRAGACSAGGGPMVIVLTGR